jgi:hypothetical protein
MATYQSKLTYHFKRPHSPNPHFYFAFDPIDIFEFDTLPPASAGWFSPEQQEFLCHADCIVIRQITSDVGAKFSQRKAANDRLVRFGSTVTPPVVSLETTAIREYTSKRL